MVYTLCHQREIAHRSVRPYTVIRRYGTHRKEWKKSPGRSSSRLGSLDTLTRRFNSKALLAHASARFETQGAYQVIAGGRNDE